jgi:hypothetical protein
LMDKGQCNKYSIMMREQVKQSRLFMIKIAGFLTNCSANIALFMRQILLFLGALYFVPDFAAWCYPFF